MNKGFKKPYLTFLSNLFLVLSLSFGLVEGNIYTWGFSVEMVCLFLFTAPS